jgi:hypothetical protein
VTTPPSRPPQSWNGEGEVLGVVPLLRPEGGEKESQFGLVAPEDGRPAEAEALFLPLTPDEALVVQMKCPTTSSTTTRVLSCSCLRCSDSHNPVRRESPLCLRLLSS